MKKNIKLNNNYPKCLLILGAKSDIALRTAYLFAERGYNIILSSRNSNELKKTSEEINKLYKIKCYLMEFDILEYEKYEKFFDNLPVMPNVLLCAAGKLETSNSKRLINSKSVKEIIDTNYTANVIFIENFVQKFVMKNINNSFSIIGISSVAGDRGRALNYLYGSAKSGFSEYLSGLRQKFNSSNLHVITIKPGYVKTKMTKDIKILSFLSLSSMRMAHIIYQAHVRKKHVVYSPYWRYIMLIIQIIPEFIFKKLKF